MSRPNPPVGAETAAGAPRDRLLPFTLCFTAGALGLLLLPQLPAWRWIFAASLPALLPWRGRAGYAALLLGALLSFWQAQTRLAERWPEARTGEEIAVTGAIVSLPDADAAEPAPAAAAESAERAAESTPVIRTTWHFVFAPDRSADTPALPARIRTSWYRSDAQLAAGQCWRFTLRLRAPRGSANPGGADYEAWLFRQRIGASASVRDAEPCGIAPGHRLLRLRQATSTQIRAWLPGDPAEPLIAALAVADKTGLSQSDWNVFRATGTVHLMVIAGLHVGFVAGFVFWLLRGLWSLSPRLCLRLPAQRAGLFGALVIAIGYALLADLEAPVLRATIMLLVLAAAALAGGLARASRGLALAWLLVVGTDPLGLLAPGLWLSFGAVAAILYVGAAAGGERKWWRELLRLQVMLSLAVAPLTLFFFQGASFVGPVANLLALPAMAVLLPALLASLVLAALVPALGLPLLHFAATATAAAYRGLEWLAVHAPQAWWASSAAPAALGVALVGVLLLFAPRGLPLRRLALACFLPMFFAPPRAPQSGFELTALDVGQGLAVVVRTAHHALLFDAGPAYDEGFDAGRSVVAPFLLHEGLRKLDVMMISHADLDHRGGAPAVRSLLKVAEERGAMAGTPCAAGQGWEWDGVRFEVLNGPAAAITAPASADAKPARGHSHNNEGCVLRVSAGQHAALLPADIERASEARLIEAGTLLSADVLLAPHHGSKTSSTQEFVDAVAPDVVIFPAGYHNQFQHPRAEVVARYAARGARLYMTGHAGAVSVRVDADGVHAVREWRRESPHLWSAPWLPVPTDNGGLSAAGR